jgi:ATP-binding cassette subfamily B multidrug efflux pump
MRYFDRTPIGTLVTRVISDIETIDDIFSQGLLLIMGDILKLVVVVVVMFVVNWKLALLSMVPIPILLWSTNIFKNSIQKSFQDVRTQVARLNAFVQEHIQGMSVVQLFGREQQEFEQVPRPSTRSTAQRTSVACWPTASSSPWWRSSAPSRLAALIWWGMGDVLEGVATFGDVWWPTSSSSTCCSAPSANWLTGSTYCRWAWWQRTRVQGARYGCIHRGYWNTRH